MIKVRQAVMLLADAVGVFKTRLDSDLGRAVIKALNGLAPVTPGVQEGLGQSEVASLIAGLSPVRSAPPHTLLGTRVPVPQLMGGTPPLSAPVPVPGR